MSALKIHTKLIHRVMEDGKQEENPVVANEASSKQQQSDQQNDNVNIVEEQDIEQVSSDLQDGRMRDEEMSSENENPPPASAAAATATPEDADKLHESNGESPPSPPAALAADEETQYHGLRPMDVLMGRGTGPNQNPGNMHFRQVVLDVYQEHIASQPAERPGAEQRGFLGPGTKSMLARIVQDRIARDNGRFLQKLTAAEARDHGLDSPSLIVIRHPSSSSRTANEICETERPPPRTYYYKMVEQRKIISKIKQTIRFMVEQRPERERQAVEAANRRHSDPVRIVPQAKAPERSTRAAAAMPQQQPSSTFQDVALAQQIARLRRSPLPMMASVTAAPAAASVLAPAANDRRSLQDAQVLLASLRSSGSTRNMANDLANLQRLSTLSPQAQLLRLQQHQQQILLHEESNRRLLQTIQDLSDQRLLERLLLQQHSNGQQLSSSLLQGQVPDSSVPSLSDNSMMAQYLSAYLSGRRHLR